MNSGCSASSGSRRAVRTLLADQFVPAAVARRLHRHRRAGAAHHQHCFHARRAGTFQRLVDVHLQRHFLAAAQTFVGGDDEFGCRIGNPSGQRIRRKAAEHHRVHRADARAGEHRDCRFGNHRHIDGDAVALRHAETFQQVRGFANLLVQLAIADRFGFVRIVAFPEDRGFVAALFQMTVQAIRRQIQLAVVIPADVQVFRIVRNIFDLGIRLGPVQPLADARPEFLRIPHRLGVHFFVVGLLDARVCGEVVGNGMDLRHDASLFVRARSRLGRADR